jgi:phosphocarrier protein
MTEKVIKIINRAGIHARPAAMLVEASKDLNCNIYYEKDTGRINGKSIMGLLTLGAAYNTELKIIAEGEDEAKAVEVLSRLFELKFEEE